jgi:hypothetical protein
LRSFASFSACRMRSVATILLASSKSVWGVRTVGTDRWHDGMNGSANTHLAQTLNLHLQRGLVPHRHLSYPALFLQRRLQLLVTPAIANYCCTDYYCSDYSWVSPASSSPAVGRSVRNLHILRVCLVV